MLDKLLKNIHLAGPEPDAEEIQADIADLTSEMDEVYAELEQIRGEWRDMFATGETSGKGRVAADLRIREERATDRKNLLRQKRSALLEKLAPAAPPPLVSFPMPAAIVTIDDRLAKLRADRERYLRETKAAVDERDDVAARKFVRAREDAEVQIKALRMDRAALIEPYNAALQEALTPLCTVAAGKLLAAVLDAKEAVDLLNRASKMAPPVVYGVPNPLCLRVDVDQLPFNQLEAFARSLGAGEGK